MNLKGIRMFVVPSAREDAVIICIPRDLIDLARTYPAIDWNEVMKRAIANASIPQVGSEALIDSPPLS